MEQAEMQLVLWGVVAQWVTLIGSGIAYYMVRIRKDLQWKSNMEHMVSGLDARIAGIERNRRKEDRFQTVDGCRIDKQSCIRLTEMATKDMGRKLHEFQACIDEMRRKSEAFHARRDDRFDQLSAEISAMKEAMSAMATAQEIMGKSVDRMMDHVLKGGE